MFKSIEIFWPCFRFCKDKIIWSSEIWIFGYNFKAHTTPMSKASKCKSDKLGQTYNGLTNATLLEEARKNNWKSASKETNFNPWHSVYVCLAFSFLAIRVYLVNRIQIQISLTQTSLVIGLFSHLVEY